MSDKYMDNKPMISKSAMEILKQDYELIKVIKEKPKSNYAKMYKEMLENKEAKER